MIPKCEIPLLMQGIRMSGKTANVAANTTVTNSAVVEQARGKVIYLDVMNMAGPSSVTAQDANISLQTGGVDLLRTVPLEMYSLNAYSQEYQLCTVDLEAGQKIGWTLDNSLSVDANNAMIHLYYENPFLLSKELLDQYYSKGRGLKEVVYKYKANPAVALVTSGKVQLPSDQGNIIGVQIYGDNGRKGASADDLFQARLSANINGKTIFEDVCLGYGFSKTSRPIMKFPISVEKSGTFTVSVDTTNCADPVYFGLKFFFGR